MKDAVDIREGKKFAKALEKAGKGVNLVAGDQQGHTIGYFLSRCNQCNQCEFRFQTFTTFDKHMKLLHYSHSSVIHEELRCVQMLN